MFTKGKIRGTTEADFDVLRDITVNGATIPKAVVVWIFLDWTFEENAMQGIRMGSILEKRTNILADLSPATRDATLRLQYAPLVIKALKRQGLIRKHRKKGAGFFSISPRGEQVRQFYVLKLGLKGTLHDRMDRFSTA